MVGFPRSSISTMARSTASSVLATADSSLWIFSSNHVGWLVREKIWWFIKNKRENRPRENGKTGKNEKFLLYLEEKYHFGKCVWDKNIIIWAIYTPLHHVVKQGPGVYGCLQPDIHIFLNLISCYKFLKAPFHSTHLIFFPAGFILKTREYCFYFPLLTL